MFSVTSKNIQTERSELKIKTTKLDKELKGLKYTLMKIKWKKLD